MAARMRSFCIAVFVCAALVLGQNDEPTEGRECFEDTDCVMEECCYKPHMEKVSYEDELTYMEQSTIRGTCQNFLKAGDTCTEQSRLQGHCQCNYKMDYDCMLSDEATGTRACRWDPPGK